MGRRAVTESDVAHALSSAGLQACLDICNYDRAPHGPHRKLVQELIGKQC